MTYEDEFRNFFGVDSFYSTWNDQEGEYLQTIVRTIMNILT